MLLRARRFAVPSVDPLTSVQREMEQLFGRVLNGTSDTAGRSDSWQAAVAMWGDTDKVYFEMELPGVTKDDIDVTVHNGTLTISGERKRPDGDRTYWVNDRRYGTFDRSVALPDDVDADSIDAQLTNGVLQIVLCKRPEAQPKKITVKD